MPSHTSRKWSLGLVGMVCLTVVLQTTDIVGGSLSADDKVYYGEVAKQNEFPFVVYMNRTGSGQRCTGSLIERRWVLTAAHCLFNDSRDYVVVGDYDAYEDDDTEQAISIDREVQHPDFSPATLANDVGLIYLSKPANIRSEAAAKIAPLKSKAFLRKMLNNEKNCRTLGWGYMNSPDNAGAIAADRLQKTAVRFAMLDEVLAKGYPYFENMTGVIAFEPLVSNACGQTGGVCPGDSGGPTVCRRRGQWVQTGITSFGDDLDGCTRGIKGLTDVQFFYSWIQSVING